MFDIEKLSFPSVNPRKLELDFLRDRFYESLSLRGFPARLFMVDSQDEEFNGDPSDLVYKNPIDTFIHLEEFPKRTILSAMGWLNENSEQQPIAYLPTFYIDDVSGEKLNFYPKKNTKIQLQYDTLSDEHASRLFLVSDIKADSPYVTNWIVLLVPHRERYVAPTPVPPPPVVPPTTPPTTPPTPPVLDPLPPDPDFTYLKSPTSSRRR